MKPARGAKRPSTQPIEPRFDDELGRAGVDELLDDPQWSRLRIDADLAGQTMHRLDISGCRFEGCRLTGADLQGARVVDTIFEDCELSGVSPVDAVLTRVVLRNCRMSGLVLSSAKLRDVRIADCKLDGLSMRMATTERVVVERCPMRNADLSGATLEHTRLFDNDLTGADFSKTRFADVRFHGSDLAGLHGIEHLRGIAIDPEQMPDFAMALLTAHGVAVEDDREPSAT